jgi:hypothetical protein
MLTTDSKYHHFQDSENKMLTFSIGGIESTATYSWHSLNRDYHEDLLRLEQSASEFLENIHLALSDCEVESLQKAQSQIEKYKALCTTLE